jgi:hypothetical protein
MKKHFNKMTAKNLLIIGGSMFAVSLFLNFITAFSVYGKVDGCLDKSADCSLGTEQIAGKIAMVIGYVGIGLLVTGIGLLLIEVAKKRKQ